MTTRAHLVLALAAWLIAGHSVGQAQSIDRLYGTLDVESQDLSSAGKLIGCSLVFNALVRDFVYRAGAPVTANGSVSLMNSGDRVGVTLKLVLNDAALTPEGFRFSPSAPTFAFLRSPSGLINADELVAKSASDTPGSLFSIYQLSEKFLQIFTEMAETSKVAVVYNRHDGGLDAAINLELDVISSDEIGNRTRSTEPMEKFLACALILMN